MEYHQRRSTELLGAAGVLVLVSLVAIVADDYVFKDLDLVGPDPAEVASAIALRSDLRSLWNGITILTWTAAFGTAVRSLWHDTQATRTSRPLRPRAETEATKARLAQLESDIAFAEEGKDANEPLGRLREHLGVDEPTRRLHQYWVPIFLAIGAVALFIYRYQLSVDTAP